MYKLGLAAGTAFFCSLLSGCGIYQVNSEARHYQDELKAAAVNTYKDCRSGKKTSMTQNRIDGVPDCFDLVVKESPKRVTYTPDAMPVRDGDKQLASPKPKDAYERIDQFALMAMFSRMVYHRYEQQSERNSEVTCTANPDKHPLNALYGSSTARSGWSLWEDGKKGCFAKNGLFFETYVYSPKPYTSITKAVIVFRGTENYASELAKDWGTDIASAFGIKPEEYSIAAEQLPTLTKSLKEANPDVEIYAAGHSLGGGLAQMAAYWSKDIKAAYAFNSTPVTGWTWIHRHHRQAGTLEQMNGDPTIYRISQGTEGLSVLRRVSTAVNNDRFGRSDYIFDFRLREAKDYTSTMETLRAGIHQHDMGLLACNMAARVVLAHPTADDRAEFDYTKDMALKAWRQADQLVGEADKTKELLCTTDVREEIKKSLCSGDKPTELCAASVSTSP